MALALEIAAVDRIAYLERDTLSIEQDATSYLATAEFVLADIASAITPAVKDVVYIHDGSTVYFYGSISDVTCINYTKNNATARQYTVRCQDAHAELEKRIVDSATFAADTYSDLEIIDALFAAYYASGIDYTTYPTGTPLVASMEEMTWEGVTLRQALSDVCGMTGGKFYVHYAGGVLYFHYFSSESNAAAFGLSDTPNGSTTFGYEQLEEKIDATQLCNAFYIVGQDDEAWVTDATSISSWGRHEATINDAALLTAGAIADRGAALLLQYKNPRTYYRVTTDHGVGLRAGMQINLEWSTKSIDASFNINRTRLYLRDDVLLFDLDMGNIPPTWASSGRSIGDTIQHVTNRITVVEGDVFDIDGPAAPDLQVANLSTGVNVQADGTQLVFVVVTWGSVADDDLDQYEVQISTAADFSANVQTRLHAKDGGRAERWEGLLGGTTYYVRVRALDWVGNPSAWSTTRSIASAADTTAPADPTGLTATATALAVYLKWTGVADADLADYVIQRAPNVGGSPGTYATIATAKTTFFIDDSITPETSYWYRINATDTSDNASGWVQIAGLVTPRLVTGTDADLELLDWNHTLVFSATDYNTVAWAAGTIRLSDDSTTYNISGGNTGNIAATTYIFLDTDVSVTVLQTTTTASSAVGTNRLLVAVAKPTASGKDAEFYVMKGYGTGVYITADQIAANTITANEIAANTITATEIAAGTITTTEIAANTIAAGNIAADTITAAEIAANAITTTELNALAVTTAKLAAGAVTVEKLDVVVGGYNLLLNSGMNDDDDGNGVPDEWTLEGTASNYTIVMHDTVKVVGAYSVRLWSNAAGNLAGQYRDIRQSVTLAGVPLAIGDAFTLSGYLYTWSMTNLRAEIEVTWFDAGSAVISTHYAAQVTIDQGWTRHTVSDTVPAGAVTVRISCRITIIVNDGTGAVYFDAIKLERGDVPTAWTSGLIGHVTIDANRVQVTDASAKVWLGKRGAVLGLFGENSAGALQVYVDASDGRLYCGAGAVTADEDGITLTMPNVPTFDSPMAIKWTDGTGAVRLWAFRDSGPTTGAIYEIVAPSGDVAHLEIRSSINLVAQPEMLMMDSDSGTELAGNPLLLQSGTYIGTNNNIRIDGAALITDGITAPGALAGWATVYVDVATGDLMVKFGDGVTKTLATDT